VTISSWLISLTAFEGMDFLNSIMEKVDQGPSLVSDREKEYRKREKMKREAQRKELEHFQSKVRKAVHKFKSDANLKVMQYPPMPSQFRAVIHDVCEEESVVSHSFDGKDSRLEQFTMIYKPHSAPTEEQLQILTAQYKGDPLPVIVTQNNPDGESSVLIPRSQKMEEKLLRNKLALEAAQKNKDKTTTEDVTTAVNVTAGKEKDVTLPAEEEKNEGIRETCNSEKVETRVLTPSEINEGESYLKKRKYNRFAVKAGSVQVLETIRKDKRTIEDCQLELAEKRKRRKMEHEAKEGNSATPSTKDA